MQNLQLQLDKAEKWAAERKIDPNAILHARLAPDMFHFTRQVQVMTDLAKGTVARLAGLEPPRYEDTETTFPELKARVAKTPLPTCKALTRNPLKVRKPAPSR